MARVQVSVLRGGPSFAYDVSLNSGNSVLSHLSPDRYDVKDVLISQSGQWHMRGLPVSPQKVLHATDVVFNALHGNYGEDGVIQRLLDTYGVPYTGSGAHTSALAIDKGRAREALRGVVGVKMPQYIILKEEEAENLVHTAAHIFQKFGPAYIIKPLRGGASRGIQMAHTLRDLPDALSKAFYDSDVVIVEQFITGRDATVATFENFRGEDIYTPPAIEIRLPREYAYFGNEAKNAKAAQKMCPGTFSDSEKAALAQAARAVHSTLKLSQYATTDFRVSPHGIYFLETNTLPGLSETSMLGHSLEAIGSSMPEFLDHVVSLAMKKK